MPEFPVEGGRLDFVGARWAIDERRLEIIGVECKGETTPGEVWQITSEQMRRYLRCVPALYFACSVKSADTADAFQSLCRIATVGFIAFQGSELEPHVHDAPAQKIGARLEEQAYLEQVHTKIAMRFAFRSVFGEGIREAENWIATNEPSDQVQWNAVLNGGGAPRVLLGLNIENARRVLEKSDLAALAAFLATLPETVGVRATLERYYAPRRRSGLPVLRTRASEVDLADLEYLRELSTSGLIHVTVEIPLWEASETRHREWYEKSVRAAQGTLSPLFDRLSAPGGSTSLALAPEAIGDLEVPELPITELPLFESTIWESAALSEIEGDHTESVKLAAMLSELGYEVGWETDPKPHMWLRHLSSGQILRRGTSEN
jgi:hypothetical protein